jgi:hypothetical protein
MISRNLAPRHTEVLAAEAIDSGFLSQRNANGLLSACAQSNPPFAFELKSLPLKIIIHPL